MKPTKEQQVIEDWKAYNKRNKSSRMNPMSLSDYKDWINGTVKKTKPKQTTKEPILSKPSWAATTDHIGSVKPNMYVAGKISMVDRAKMGLESPEVSEEIIRKSKRIGLMYSKGAYSYITDETDLKDLGKKNPTMK